jgi:Protein of unknown function (DUF3455)
MKQKSKLAPILAAALSVATAVAAQSPTEPPPSQHAILTVNGEGVQIYNCQQSAGTPQWVFQAPEATLLNTAGDSIGTHAAGPIWRSNDGSTVKGDLLQKSPSPEASAIPWLLLKASGTTGSGIMSKVEFIRRSHTHGGVAPTSGCDTQHLASTARVSYTATYTFYSAKP